MNKWMCNNCDDGPCFAETRNERAHECEYDITPKACVCGYFEDAPWEIDNTRNAEIKTLSRALDAACERLAEVYGCMISTDCPWPNDVSVDCADCWRRYLLAQAEQERDEG